MSSVLCPGNQRLLGFRFGQPLSSTLHRTALLVEATHLRISNGTPRVVKKCDGRGTNTDGTMYLGTASQRFCQWDSPRANPATLINWTAGGSKGYSYHITATAATSKGDRCPTNSLGQKSYHSLHPTNKPLDASTKHKKQHPRCITAHQPCLSYFRATTLHRNPRATTLTRSGSRCHTPSIKLTEFCSNTPFPQHTVHQPGRN
jgi:hypothetical protein